MTVAGYDAYTEQSVTRQMLLYVSHDIPGNKILHKKIL